MQKMWCIGIEGNGDYLPEYLLTIRPFLGTKYVALNQKYKINFIWKLDFLLLSNDIKFIRNFKIINKLKRWKSKSFTISWWLVGTSSK